VTSEKRTKQKCKAKWKALQEIRTSRRQNPELEDEMLTKGNTEELLDRQLMTCERNMQ
jgi:hypothetical protein